jgi:hypothetical protein
MTSTAPLAGSHRRTYDTIFQHPISHNLAWRDVHALFRHLGQVEIEPNGNLKVTRHGQTLMLHAPRTKEVASNDELMALRHFLEKSDAAPLATQSAVAEWLVVIDHREARIYRSAEPGSVPQQIRPAHRPEDFSRPAPNARESSRSAEKPNPHDFYEQVTGVLNGAGKILVFGSGTGHSSEMEQFVAWLHETRPDLGKRIVGMQVIDEHHLTEAQVLAKARSFYADAGGVH